MAGLASYAAAIITLPIARGPAGAVPQGFEKRELESRATITSELFNNLTRGSYHVEVNVGTPPQRQTLFLDTGSSDVWLLDSNADLCTNTRLQHRHRGGCGTTFNSEASSTYAVTHKNAFDITYLDETGANGDYVTDKFTIGGATIDSLQMGHARNSTIGSGLMGIGYSVNEASNSRKNVLPPFTYPSAVEEMVAAGLITRKAYSLYLNDLGASTGSIIFGGMDSDKFVGDLLQLPVIPSKYANGTSVYAELGVAMTSFGITGQQGNIVNLTSSSFQEPVLLDSGTTFSYLPRALVKDVYRSLNVIDDSSESGLLLVDCAILKNSPKLTIDFGFGGPSGIQIRVPVDEVVFSLTSLFNLTPSQIPSSEFETPCAFGIYSNSETNEFSLLGDSFLRSAYVVYDLESNLIALGQTNFNSTTSKLVEFQANATSIPMISGVASQVYVTQTGIGGLPGVGILGGGKTTTVSPSRTGTAATATSRSASVNIAVLGFDTGALMVLAITGSLVGLGGSGWFAWFWW
ncbi:aspartic-type endopeptidase [Amylocarpus encephaloides]|uniref:Aspartic-type endopeptidase n=1 Tax=Amylocarpus encephaloides TaxID=45428 RepID=A0A9P7YDA4_9HELO|nr:aspartic-type endopeptidase [Amylocarpus encephaloides]